MENNKHLLNFGKWTTATVNDDDFLLTVTEVFFVLNTSAINILNQSIKHISCIRLNLITYTTDLGIIESTLLIRKKNSFTDNYGMNE